MGEKAKPCAGQAQFASAGTQSSSALTNADAPIPYILQAPSSKLAPTMASNRIDGWEVARYWELFSSLVNGGTYLSGGQAAQVLKNSQLRDDQLERV
ncbi:MAG: endocytosis defective- protein [Vezdaea aestivalis]|nr:MAG: endocytosis defective- protein [Vezdaea aestivalis]